MGHETAAKKSLGQHWLDDQRSLHAMCEAADINANDTVLEIGPGHGSLTKLLTSRAKQVIAVEFDRQLAASLPSQMPATNLTVIPQDILGFDFTSLPSGYKIVANIPYYLTSHLIQVISVTPNPPMTAVLLVQKEVAQRVAAKPGYMSLLSVTAQFYWEVSLGSIVSAELFVPPPKVDSQILILEKRPAPLFPEIDPKNFFRLVKTGFAQRRKTLHNSLSSGLHLSREQVSISCEKASIDPKRRAQTLSLQEWYQLYQATNN